MYNAWCKSCSSLELSRELSAEQLAALEQQLERSFRHVTQAKLWGSYPRTVRRILQRLPGLVQLQYTRWQLTASPDGQNDDADYLRLLAELPQSLRSLDLGYIVLCSATLMLLARLTKLTELKLSQCTNVSAPVDICQAAAEQLTELQSLSIIQMSTAGQQAVDGIIRFATAVPSTAVPSTAVPSLTRLELGDAPMPSLVALSSLRQLRDLTLGCNVPAAVQQQLFSPLQQLIALSLQRQTEPVAAAVQVLKELRGIEVHNGWRREDMQPLDEASTSAILAHPHITRLAAAGLTYSAEWAADAEVGIRDLTLYSIPEQGSTAFTQLPHMPHLQTFAAGRYNCSASKRWYGAYRLLGSVSSSLRSLELSYVDEVLPRSMPQLQTLKLCGTSPRQLAALQHTHMPQLQHLDLVPVEEVQLEDLLWVTQLPALKSLSDMEDPVSDSVSEALHARLCPFVEIMPV